jgi:hypothetical protein
MKNWKHVNHPRETVELGGRRQNVCIVVETSIILRADAPRMTKKEENK